MLFFQHSACRHFSSSVSGDRPPLEMKTTPSQGLIRSAEVCGRADNKKHKIQDKEGGGGKSRAQQISKHSIYLTTQPRHCAGTVAQMRLATLGRCTDSSPVLFFGCSSTPNVHLPCLDFNCNACTLPSSNRQCRNGDDAAAGQRAPSP